MTRETLYNIFVNEIIVPISPHAVVCYNKILIITYITI